MNIKIEGECIEVRDLAHAEILHQIQNKLRTQSEVFDWVNSGCPEHWDPNGDYQEALENIFALMDGQEWGPDTLDNIAAVLKANGFTIRSTDI